MNTALFTVAQAKASQVEYALQICEEMAASAQARGTGIARRSPEYIAQKMIEGKAVIALHEDGTWAGFCYIETWSHGNYVANSGLIVNPIFRQEGLAKEIKRKIFELSREKYPNAKIFGLTTGFAVMKINSELGYKPVPYSELTQDESFWKGCESCINFPILQSKDKKNCLCTALLWTAAAQEREPRQGIDQSAKAPNRLERLYKKISFLKQK
ncbi:GNAT family N-acetyltransferase [Flavobacterium sp. JP2137]|uniref:GNAT family N-acetyltransferase n=1 Tax=Flavobacterium sp. JP2137 TaxID=3414510 RepID=UPI003D2FB31D